MNPLPCSMQSLVFYFSYYGTGQFARPDSCFILWTKCFEQKANSLCCNTFIIFLLASFEIPTLPNFILKYWVSRICPTNKRFFFKISVFPKFSRPCYPSRSFFGATDPYKSTLCQTSPYESWQPTRKQLCFAQRVNFKERAKDLFSPSRMLSGSSVVFRQWSVVLFWYPGGH